MEVTDPKAVKVLMAEQAGLYLEAYLGQTRSVSEAADHVERSVQRVHYWTRRFLDVGLVEVVEVVQRPGRPIRRYRCIADEFVIPAVALPPGTFEAQMQEMNRGLTWAFTRNFPELVHGGDLRIHRTEPSAAGITYDRGVAGGDVPEDAIQSSFTMRLSRAEAARLRAELTALRDRWIAIGAERGAGRAAYLSVVAIAPMPDE